MSPRSFFPRAAPPTNALKRGAFTVAIVGRPNVGKSTLFNALRDVRGARDTVERMDDIFEEQASQRVPQKPRKFRGSAARPQLTGPVARTTRDVRVAPGRLGDVSFDLVDTAGYEVSDADEATFKKDDPYGRNWVGMTDAMLKKTEERVVAADVVVHLLDARQGLTGLDVEVADFLRRKSPAPRLVVFNKCEDDVRPETVDVAAALKFASVVSDGGGGGAEGWQTGTKTRRIWKEPLYVSAQHGDGMPDLLEALRTAKEEADLRRRQKKKKGSDHHSLFSQAQAQALADTGGNEEEPEEEENEKDAAARKAEEDATAVRLAFVGRPNVGKSSLLNRLAGQEIALSSSMPGATRDPVEWPMTFKGRSVVLVDTAGVRGGSKKSLGLVAGVSSSKETETVERSARRAAARQLTREADVVCLLVDTSVGRVEADDLRLARRCVEDAAGPVVVVATKVDLFGPSRDILEMEKSVAAHLRDTVKSIDPVVVATSTETSEFSSRRQARLDPARVVDAALAAYDAFVAKKIPTKRLNNWLRDWLATPVGKPDVKRMRKIKFLSQTATRPPTFLLHGRNLKQNLDGTCLDGLRRAIVTDFGLRGSRVQFDFKESAKPSPVQNRHFDYKKRPGAPRNPINPASVQQRKLVGPMSRRQRKASAFVKTNLITPKRRRGRPDNNVAQQQQQRRRPAHFRSSSATSPKRSSPPRPPARPARPARRQSQPRRR